MQKSIYGNLPTILPAGFLKERVNLIREHGLPQGYYTGISNLDNVFRIDKGRLITITGVPNCGKSEFVDFYLTVLNKRYGLKPLYFSPENQPCELHISKLISKYTNKSIEELTQSEIDRATDYIVKNFFFCNYEKVKTLDDIEAQIIKQFEVTPIDSIVIDAYNKVESEKPANETETEFISKVLDRLCEIAIKYNIIVILVAHPHKMDWKSNDKVAMCPTAYQINGSANFFNKSDFVLAVHRDRKEEDETVTIRVDKVKFSHYGKQGKCELKYDLASGNYYNAPAKYDYGETKYVPIPFTLPELPVRKEPLDVLVSLYSGSSDNIGTEICLKDFLLTDRYKPIAEQIRAGKTLEQKKEIKDSLKHNIPAATISGRFSKREMKSLIEPSGLICIDIDFKDNPEIMPQVPTILQGLDYVAYYGESISGTGYLAIIPIENPNHFKQHYYAIEEDMKSYGITIDKSCKDITRMRYASFDENYYYNPNATTYYWEKDKECSKSAPQKTPKTRNEKKNYTCSSSMTDKEIVTNQLEFLKNSNMTIPDDYNTWFNIGMALNTSFGEDGRSYFHEFSKLSNKYDETECNTQYDNIVSHYEGQSEITLGTLCHIVNEVKNKYN